MTKKNLSILIYSLANGGAERVVSILTKKLSNKHNITLVLMNKTIFYDIAKNINIVFLENSNPAENGILKLIKLPFLGWKYKNICKSKKIDISLSFLNRPNYINIFAKLFGSDTKTIVCERAMPSLQHKKGLQGSINRVLIKSLYPVANLIVANSKGNTRDLKENFNLKNIYTIENLLDLEKIYFLSQKPLVLKDDKFIFITIGRLDEGKNHKLIIKSMLEIDGYLYIIGDGELKNDLQLQIKNLNLQKKVFLLGKVNNPYKYLNQANCFVFSSNYEGFPNVLIEALSCSIPIISTDCKSGPREILAPDTDFKKKLNSDIELAKYGILTTVNDKRSMIKAMKLILTDKKLRENYKEKSIKRAEDFEIQKIIKKWESVLCVQ